MLPDYINRELNVTLCNADWMSVTIPQNRSGVVITDPPYDLAPMEMRAAHKEFERIVGENWKIIFCPPENQWKDDGYVDLTNPQYLFWAKPVSTKNTSKAYSRFVEIIKVYGRGYWDNERQWSNYVNVFHDYVDVKTHPHRKPLSLAIRLIENHTIPGEVIIDPYMGSGVFGKAAVLTGRGYIGVEIDPEMFAQAANYISRVTL